MKHPAFFPHSTRGCKYQRCESSLLNINNSACVLPLLLVLMYPINLLRFQVPIAFSIWVTDPDVEKGWLLRLPKSACMYIQSGISRCVRPSCQLLTWYILQHWFSNDIATNQIYQLRFQIPQFIMPLNDKPPSLTYHGVVNIKQFPAHTAGWNIVDWP